jgi:tetratricopeptide (TPR) repeat protein
MYRPAADITWDQVLRVRALYGAGQAADCDEQPKKAIEAFGTLSREVVCLARGDMELAELYERTGDYPKALKFFERHKENHPEDAAEVDRHVADIEAPK